MIRNTSHPHLALAAALPLPSGDAVPDWVHLLPVTRGAVETYDGRGPYQVTDIDAIIAESMAWERGIPIDENHATDLAAPEGREAPARGWIVEMQARTDGLWGRVEWTRAGRELVSDRAYRGISPVMMLHPDKKTVRLIPRASLVNTPNLRGLAALNQESPMNFMEKLAELLGFEPGATEDQILAAIQAWKTKEPEDVAELQSAMAEIGLALGVRGGPADIVAAAKSSGKAAPTEIVALQSELAAVAGQLSALRSDRAKESACTFVDGQIKAGRVGLKPVRDRYIAMHMADPAGTEDLIKALPMMTPSGATVAPPAKDGEVSLNAEQAQAARLLGIAPKDYLATLQAERATEETR